MCRSHRTGRHCLFIGLQLYLGAAKAFHFYARAGNQKDSGRLSSGIRGFIFRNSFRIRSHRTYPLLVDSGRSSIGQISDLSARQCLEYRCQRQSCPPFQRIGIFGVVDLISGVWAKRRGISNRGPGLRGCRSGLELSCQTKKNKAWRYFHLRTFPWRRGCHQFSNITPRGKRFNRGGHLHIDC